MWRAPTTDDFRDAILEDELLAWQEASVAEGKDPASKAIANAVHAMGKVTFGEGSRFFITSNVGSGVNAQGLELLNDARVRAVLGPSHPVIAAVVYVATAMAGPGHVQHFGHGELVVGPSPASAHLAQALAQAGIPTEVSANVRGALWAKLVINCAYNALSAITQRPYGWLVQQDGASAVIADLVAECLAVAQADGVRLDGDIHAGVRDIAQSMPAQLSSTAQDLARGRPSEIEHLNGYVVRRGAALGVATPVNQALLVLVRMAEAARATAPAPARQNT